jgi:hypothetical protein
MLRTTGKGQMEIHLAGYYFDGAALNKRQPKD